MSNVFYKIVFSFMFLFLIIALVISLTGFNGPIQFDTTYYSFLQRVAYEYQSWHIEIPDIPSIPTQETIPVIGFLVDFVNFLINILNVVVLILNKIIELILFIVALIKILIEFKDYDFATEGVINWWWNA